MYCLISDLRIDILTFNAMSRSLHEAVKVGKVEEVIIRLNIGEDIDQSYPPRY